ncbi:hypothetical protein ACX1HN_20235 [Yersinia pseudotuberculosis]
MTPREIELLTIAKLEHEGHQLTQADQREIHRSIQSSIAYRAKYPPKCMVSTGEVSTEVSSKKRH